MTRQLRRGGGAARVALLAAIAVFFTAFAAHAQDSGLPQLVPLKRPKSAGDKADAPKKKDKRAAIAVLHMGSVALSADQTEAYARKAGEKIAKANNYRLISRKVVKAAVADVKFDGYDGCTSVDCLAEKGDKVGARFVLVGKLSRLADLFIVELRLIDVRKKEEIKKVEKDCRCNGGAADELVVLAASELGGGSAASAGAAPAKAEISVTSEPPEADVWINKIPMGKAPITLPVDAGFYQVAVTLPGYVEKSEIIEAKAGETAEVVAKLEPDKAAAVEREERERKLREEKEKARRAKLAKEQEERQAALAKQKAEDEKRKKEEAERKKEEAKRKAEEEKQAKIRAEKEKKERAEREKKEKAEAKKSYAAAIAQYKDDLKLWEEKQAAFEQEGPGSGMLLGIIGIGVAVAGGVATGVLWAQSNESVSRYEELNAPADIQDEYEKAAGLRGGAYGGIGLAAAGAALAVIGFLTIKSPPKKPIEPSKPSILAGAHEPPDPKLTVAPAPARKGGGLLLKVEF